MEKQSGFVNILTIIIWLASLSLCFYNGFKYDDVGAWIVAFLLTLIAIILGLDYFVKKFTMLSDEN